MQFDDIALIFPQDDDARRFPDESAHHDAFVSEIFCIIKATGVLKIVRDFEPGLESYRIPVLEFLAAFDINEQESFNPGIGIKANQPAC